MKIKIAMILELEENLIDWKNKEEREWLFKDVLPKSSISIFCDEIGDEITKRISIINYQVIDKSGRIQEIKLS